MADPRHTPTASTIRTESGNRWESTLPHPRVPHTEVSTTVDCVDDLFVHDSSVILRSHTFVPSSVEVRKRGRIWINGCPSATGDMAARET